MELKDWLNSINFTKQNLIEEDPSVIKDYPPYIINRCLSGHLDAIMFANEVNKFPNLDKDLQYHFFLNTLRKKKRFSPWLRKEKVTDLEIIKQYYGYGNVREVLLGEQDKLVKGQNWDKFYLDNIISWWKKKAGKRYEKLKSEGRFRTEVELWTEDQDIQIIR